MGKLIVGFDSAWTIGNSGALVGVFISNQGERKALGTPIRANFDLAENVILGWQDEYNPVSTLIMLDQPTIIENITGQRPVENVVSAPVDNKSASRSGSLSSHKKTTAKVACASLCLWTEMIK
jgi:predicted RNase H-like nuclease